jgi:hypothetical protein
MHAEGGMLRRVRFTLRSVAFAVVIVSSASSCLGGLTNQIEDSTTLAVGVLDDAIGELGANSAAWQRIVQDALAKLPADVQSTIGNEVSNALSRAVAAGSAAIRCNLDFIGHRMRQQLISIRTSILGGTVPAREPGLCDVVPLAVDLNLQPERRTTLEIYGYDFDTTAIQVLLADTNRTIDVSSKLDRPTHYHMTLNLGGTGVEFSPQSQRLILRWQDQEISTIAVIQPITPVCKSRTVTVPVGNVTYVPPHTKGDKEFDGNGPSVSASVTLANRGSRVEATISMHARESKSDYTTASGSTKRTVYTPDPGEVVEDIVGPPVDSMSYKDSNETIDLFDRSASGPVRRYEFVGDTDGDEAGTRTKVTVHFNSLRLVVTENENCVSPTAARVLQVQQALSPITLQRLTPLLQNVDPEILRRALPRVQRP